MRCSILAVLDMTHGKCHAKNDMTEGNRKIGTFNKLKEEEKNKKLDYCAIKRSSKALKAEACLQANCLLHHLIA